MKTEKRKTLQGSVLFTVVCVMALLIIFLTGTLALASASTNRAHKSYSSSQASYTARAAIESFTQAMIKDDGIPAAIENLGSDSLYPEVIINDPSLGQIGYYTTDASGKTVWVPDHIEITPVEDVKDQYIFTDPKNDGNWQWVKVTTVKITATCRVGKEEETVSAYIRKSPSGISETEPGALEGLQEVGGNAFPNGGYITGGLGVGIAKDSSGLYATHNQTTIRTRITFVNGSLVGGTGSFNVNVEAPEKDNKMPYSQTVIMGNLWLKNSSFLYVDYDMKSNYTQKDIPYIYIDGTLMHDSSVNFVQGGPDGHGRGPFNVFIGTFHQGLVDPQPVNFGNSDLYLMDDYKPGEYYTARYCERDYAAEELSDETDTRTAGEKAKDKKVEIGNNYLGYNGHTCSLYNWTSSYVNKNDGTNFVSGGGNIYCKGNLTVEKVNITGDLRVAGDCTLKSGANIAGKIIVGGTLYVEDPGFSNWGKVYANNVVSDKDTTYEADVVNDGYEIHEDAVLPDFVEVPNRVYINTPLTEDQYEYRKAFQDPGDGWRWHIRYPGDDEDGSRITDINDGWGENGGVGGVQFQNMGIYVVTDESLMVLGESYGSNPPCYNTAGDGTVLETVSFNEYTIYKMDPNNPEELYVNDSGNYERVDEDCSYYKKDEEGNITGEVSKDTAKHTYYTKIGSSEPVSKAEAMGKATLSYHKLDEFGDDVYPKNMTRENIYGKYNDMGEFEEAPAATKIIKNIYEMRKQLNLTPTGEYDEEVYFKQVPKEYCLNATDDDDDTPNKLPYAFNSDGSKNPGSATEPCVWETKGDGSLGDTIIRSCIIGNEDGSEFVINNDRVKKVKIKATSVVWVVLRNVKFDGGVREVVCDTDDGKGKIKFLIQGTLNSNEGVVIHPLNFTDGCTVDAAKAKWNVEYYGEEGSKIYCRLGSTFVGTFMSPWTTFESEVAGAWGCYYKDIYGKIRNFSGELDKMTYSPIVGSAMFASVPKATNNFGVLNSGGVSASDDEKTIETTFGTYKISYFMGV